MDETTRVRKHQFHKRLPRSIKACRACRDRKIRCEVSPDTAEGCSACRSALITCEYRRTANSRSTVPAPSSSRNAQVVPAHEDSERCLSARAGPAQPYMIRKEHFPLDDAGNSRYLGPAAGYSFVASVGEYFSRQGYDSIPLPSHWRWANPPALDAPEVMLVLPPRETATKLVDSFRTTFHTWFPLLLWPSFEVKMARLYSILPCSISSNTESLRLPYCLLQIVLAIGCQFGPCTGFLSTPETPRVAYGKVFFERALHAYQWCPKNYTYDDITLLLLMACYLEGAGCGGPCYTIAGTAFRIATDMGLDQVAPEGFFTTADNRLRTRLFRACFLVDSRIALSFGRSPFFRHLDPKTRICLRANGESEAEQFPTCDESRSHWKFLVMALFSREVEAIIKNEVTGDDLLPQLRAADKRLADAWALLPPEYATFDVEQPLDPALLNILFYLQHIRLVLHRHFSDASVSSEVRTHCLSRCAEICVRSSQILRRTTLWPDAEERLKHVATDVVENHIFRCSILLLVAIFNHRQGLPPADMPAHIDHLRVMLSAMKQLASSGRSHSARSLPEVLQLAENISLHDSSEGALLASPFLPAATAEDPSLVDLDTQAVFPSLPGESTVPTTDMLADSYAFLNWMQDPLGAETQNTVFDGLGQ